MSCVRYSELVKIVRNSQRTTVCVQVFNQQVEDNPKLIYIHCASCDWYVKCYSLKELDFFRQFNKPGIINYLCLACCSDLYIRIGGEYVQSERANSLLNRTDYWGVLDINSAKSIKNTFKNANKCGSFLWEVQETFSFEKKERVLLIAVTHVRYSTNIYRYREYNDLDECTYYIAWSSADGAYYLLERTEGSVVFKGKESTRHRRLEDAIYRAQTHRQSLSDKCSSHKLRFFCVCADVKRFSQHQLEQIHPFVWKLKDLTTFYVRNYSFHFQKEIVQSCELPFSLKNRIRDFRALELFQNNLE
jgi:hypothetical protein